MFEKTITIPFRHTWPKIEAMSQEIAEVLKSGMKIIVLAPGKRQSKLTADYFKDSIKAKLIKHKQMNKDLTRYTFEGDIVLDTVSCRSELRGVSENIFDEYDWMIVFSSISWKVIPLFAEADNLVMVFPFKYMVKNKDEKKYNVIIQQNENDELTNQNIQ